MEGINNSQVNLKRIEFIVTFNCSSRCDHCSIYPRNVSGNRGNLDIDKAESIIREACGNYEIDSIMTFGGEPLLYPEFTCKLHQTARTCGIATRQIITNGQWTKNETRIIEIAGMINEAGVTDILVSTDCFHEKYLDYEIVRFSLEQLKKKTKAKLSLHPSWAGSKESENPYNAKTKEILKGLEYLEIPQSEGNIIFPCGRALANLAEYLPKPQLNLEGSCKDIPYTDPPDNIRTICAEPNGDVIACKPIGNIYEKSFSTIIQEYDYRKYPILKAMVENGCAGLYDLARENGLELAPEGYYSACGLCEDIWGKISEKK